MRSRHAFTLLELLVAAALTAALAGAMVVVIRNVAGTAARTGGRLDADARARFVLDQLQLDLEGAWFRDDGRVWLAAEVMDTATGAAGELWQTAPRNPKPVGGSSLRMNAPDLAEARFGAAGVWLRFFTTSRGGNRAASPITVSAPVAVGYRIVRRFRSTDPGDAAAAYLFHRAEARPVASGPRPGVWESGYHVTGAAYTDGTPATNSGAVPGDPRRLKVPGSAREFDAVIADHVIDFGMRAYVRDPSGAGGLRLIFPADAAGAPANAGSAALRATLPPATPAGRWGAAQSFPEVIDVMVRVLTEEGARLVANVERAQTPAAVPPAKYDGDARRWWWGVAVENSHVYTRRIVLRARPL